MLPVNLNGLPGEELITTGLTDLQCQRETVEALLIAIGEPRLRAIGLNLPKIDIENPEHRLYDLLAQEDPDSAHSKYNALINRLVSFERAAECVTE
jgi:hypothetical protein